MKQHSLPEGLAGLIDCVRLKNRHRFFYLHLRQRYLNKICTVVELLIQSFYGVAKQVYSLTHNKVKINVKRKWTRRWLDEAHLVYLLNCPFFSPHRNCLICSISAIDLNFKKNPIPWTVFKLNQLTISLYRSIRLVIQLHHLTLILS
jgi:hypothetical protein